MGFQPQIEIGSGAPVDNNQHQPMLYIDSATSKTYFRVPGTNWTLLDAGVDGVTQAELQTLAGLTSTTTELNSIDVSAANVARTATADGTGTGTIADGKMFNFVTVTCDDANKIIVLPTPTPGTHVWLQNGATGYEIRSSAPATVGINGGTGADVESAIGANISVHLFCVSATNWIGEQFTAAGVKAAVEVAA